MRTSERVSEVLSDVVMLDFQGIFICDLSTCC